MQRDNSWKKYSDKQIAECEELNKGYMDFLSACKTERECVERVVADLEKAGYRDLEKILNEGKGAALEPGDKVYRTIMGKTVVSFNIGKEPIENGMNILGAHIDSPRMDIKQNPLYESGGFAYLDTHYYGGIKKYQWVAMPLALHGVVAKKDGSVVNIAIGEKEDDPVFFVSDLLIHIADEQMKKPAAKVIEGEELDLIIGNKPITISDEEDGEEDDGIRRNLVKKAVLEILKRDYGVEEDDFVSAELEVVPAGPAREAGLDRSMILSYGQDDRVCAYTSHVAMIEAEKVDRTACCILVDKEEIGSCGATGMQSRFFENTVAEILALMGKEGGISLRRCLAKSTMLSSDVSSAFDPTFASSFDRKNASFLGRGMVIEKFTGARGKSGSNDANAEYIAHLRAIFEKEDVNFQTAEIGKVDLGGGGTIAYILALYGMNVIDSGVAVLNMHAPWEATSKADVYETKRGYVAFLENAKEVK